MKLRVLLLLAVLALTACDQIQQQRSSRARDKARQKAADGDYAEAVRYYEEALDGTAATAALHYDLALIHDDRLKDPVAAMHHFQRYLALSPRGEHAKEAQAYLSEDRLKVLTLLSSGGGMLSRQDAVRLRNENLEMRKQIAELHAKVGALRNNRPLPTVRQAKPVSPPTGSRTYIVEPGDTLAAIARKFFNNSARWKDIQDANYNQLGGGVNLKPGMSLIIPD